MVYGLPLGPSHPSRLAFGPDEQPGGRVESEAAAALGAAGKSKKEARTSSRCLAMCISHRPWMRSDQSLNRLLPYAQADTPTAKLDEQHLLRIAENDSVDQALE